MRLDATQALDFTDSPYGSTIRLHRTAHHAALAPYATDPALLPQVTCEERPPCVDFEVIWEKGSSSNSDGNISAQHNAGITTFSAARAG